MKCVWRAIRHLLLSPSASYRRGVRTEIACWVRSLFLFRRTARVRFRLGRYEADRPERRANGQLCLVEVRYRRRSRWLLGPYPQRSNGGCPKWRGWSLNIPVSRSLSKWRLLGEMDFIATNLALFTRLVTHEVPALDQEELWRSPPCQTSQEAVNGAV